MVSLCNEGWCRLLKLDYHICLTRNILSSVSIVYFLIALVHLAQFNIFYHINLGGRSIHRQVIRSGWRRLLQQRGDSEGLMLDRVRSAIGCRFFEASDPPEPFVHLNASLPALRVFWIWPFRHGQSLNFPWIKNYWNRWLMTAKYETESMGLQMIRDPLDLWTCASGRYVDTRRDSQLITFQLFQSQKDWLGEPRWDVNALSFGVNLGPLWPFACS